MAAEQKLVLEKDWNEASAREVLTNIVAFNQQHVAEADKQAPSENLSLVLRDESGEIVGGLVGKIFWNRLMIDLFWVHEKLRGQGYGNQLLTEAEQFARDKGARLIELDTISFQAPEFYKKHGYEMFGKKENFPIGHSHYHFIKWL